MINFFKRIRLFLGAGRDVQDESMIDEIVRGAFSRIHQIDPETHRQWGRLQQAIRSERAAGISERPITRYRLAWGLAVLILVVVGPLAYLTILRSDAEVFRTGRGEQKELVLEDGSRVTLSYGTELVVPERTENQPRRVMLKGEAFFRVNRGDTPFIVSTDAADVEVVGTEFNLRAREHSVEVAVLEGIVNVRAARHGRDSTLQLTQQQIAEVSRDGFPQRAGLVPPGGFPGWMHGKLFLERTTFLEACREIEMRFDVTIRLDDPRLASKEVTGILDAATAENAVRALSEVSGKKYTHGRQRYTIY